MEIRLKRFLSLAMAIVMVISMMPTNIVFATETEGGESAPSETTCSHNYEKVVTAPDCENGGYTTYTCSACGDNYTADAVDALGHSYAEEVVAPTCTEAGHTKMVCGICGDSYTVENSTVEATGHSYAEEVVAPTCTEAGHTKMVCGICGDSYTVENSTVEATGHSYAEEVVAPTCTEAGYTKMVCGTCGDNYIAENSAVEALGHEYADGKCIRCEAADPDAAVTEPTAASEPEVDEEVVRVQAMINALVAKVNSEKEAETLEAAIVAVEDAIADLFTEQAEQLDYTNLQAAHAALDAWYEEDHSKDILETGDAKIDGTWYETFDQAMAAANAMTGDVTVEIYGKVTLNTSLSGSYSSIKFIGKDTDAEIYLDVQGYITASGKKVAFEELTLSKSEGGFVTNAGFMNVAFGVYDVVEVTYTDCTFANGAYASSGKVTFNNCTFYRSHDKYGLWAYGDVDATVNGGKFADYRGIKMYAEGAAKTTDLTVKDTDFSAVTDKPAIVLTYGESVTLSGNTYSSTGTFELDLDGAPNGTTVTSTDTITAKNDNGACGVLVDGKIYTTVAQAAEVATSGSTVTLLHDSTETVVLPEGVTLDKNGKTAESVTVAKPTPGGTFTGGMVNIEDATNTFITAGISNLYATQSVVLKLYDSNKTLLATTTLQNPNYFKMESLSVKFCINGTSSSWNTVWEKDKLRADYVPAEATLFVDGAEMNTAPIQMIKANGETAINWSEVPGVPGVPVAKIGDKKYTSVAAALAYAQEQGMTDVTITLIGETTSASTDEFNLYTKTAFDSVTFKQEDASKVYYICALYTGSRTNGGSFIFDGVNIVVTDQYIFEGKVKLTNNSVVKSVAEANCFIYNSETTIEPGSKLYGVIEDFRGGDMIIDGGKTDGTYNTEPDMQDAIMVINWSGDSLTLKNGAYLKINAANEVGRLTVNAGTNLNIENSKLDAYQWIANNGTINIDGGSLITTKKITGAGKIVIDATNFDGTTRKIIEQTDAGAESLKDKVTVNGLPECTTVSFDDGDVTLVAVPPVAQIGIRKFATFADALQAAADGDTIELVSGENVISMAGNVVGGKTVTITGTAIVDWTQGNLFVGRGGEGDGKVIFDGANITSSVKKNPASTGFHVSGYDKTANNQTNNGVLVIKNSNIEVDYLINRNETIVEGNSTLTVYGGCYTHGRNESESGVAGGTTAELTIEAGSTVNVINENGMGVGGESKGVMTVKGTYNANVLNISSIGTVKVDGGSLNITGTTTNNGELTIDGGNLTNATIEGSGTTIFANTVNFYGTNSVTTSVNGSPFELIVNKGATLLISRFTMGYNRNITVYGEIENAHAFDPTGKTPSLKFNSTSGVSVGGTGTGNLTVKDAYIELGNSSWKNACGTYDWNFENSYVSATSFTNNNARGSESAVWNVTFDDSVLVAKNYIKNGVGTTYNFTNGSEATTGSLRIDGEMYIDETSSVTTTGQQNNVVGAVDEHGGINGTVTVDGILTIGSTSKTQLEMLGGELKIGKSGKVVLGENSLTIDADSKLVIDGEGHSVGTYTGIEGTVTNNGTIEVINNKVLKAELKDGKVVLVHAVAEIKGTLYWTLKEAVDKVKDGETIILIDDITFTKGTGVVSGEYVDGLVYTGDKSFTVDFDGHTITENGEINDYLIYLKNTGSKDNEITFTNGKIAINSNSTATAWAAITVGANSATHKTTLNLNGMEVVNGNPENANNQVIRVRNSSTVNLNNGTEVTSNGTSYGVVAETGSTLNINSGAKVVQTNSRTTGGNLVYTAVSGNGIINVNDGAVIESDKYGIHNLTTGNAVINIKGGTITAPTAVHAATNGGAGQTATVTITGGTFNGTLETYTNAASIKVSGGAFNAPVKTEFCADGYVPVDYGNGYHGVKVGTYEAKLNGTNYDTLAEAIAAANEGDTIELLTNVTVGTDVEVKKNITISGNGTYSIKTAGNGALHITGNNSLTLDNVTANIAVYADTTYAGATVNGQTVTGISTKTSNAVSDGANVTVTNPSWKVEVSNDKVSKFYDSLQEAINAAESGDTVTLLADCEENVTVTQAPGYAITIDGNGKTMSGTITVDGKSGTYLTSSVTIKNVNFDATNISKDASINLGDGTNATRYTCNVTVENCTFTGGNKTKAAIKSYTGGDKKLTISGCTVDATMHSLLQATNIDGVVIDECEVYSKNGINLNSSENVEIKNSTIDVSGYAVRAGVSGGTSGKITLTDNTLKTDDSEGDAVIIIRGTAAAEIELTMEKNVVSGATHISGTTAETTISANGNYWDGKDAPVVPANAAEVKVDNYYIDAALTQLGYNTNSVINMNAFANDASNTIKAGGEIHIDGVPVHLDNNLSVEIPKELATKSKMLITTYDYTTPENGQPYPSAMYVWLAKGENDVDRDGVYETFAVERVDALDDFFLYEGTSIRIGDGNNGIRFFTSVNANDLQALMNGKLINSGSLNGATMVKAGTWFKKTNEARSEVYGGEAGSNFRVFTTQEGRNWFTGVLVGFDGLPETIAATIKSRPYAELKIGEDTVTLYGGVLERSILYVAEQNANTYAQGSLHYNYVHGLITAGQSVKGVG